VVAISDKYLDSLKIASNREVAAFSVGAFGAVSFQVRRRMLVTLHEWGFSCTESYCFVSLLSAIKRALKRHRVTIAP